MISFVAAMSQIFSSKTHFHKKFAAAMSQNFLGGLKLLHQRSLKIFCLHTNENHNRAHFLHTKYWSSNGGSALTHFPFQPKNLRQRCLRISYKNQLFIRFFHSNVHFLSIQNMLSISQHWFIQYVLFLTLFNC
jgi:hypothetical protein